MPRLIANIPRIFELPSGDMIVYLTGNEHRFLMAIAPEMNWRAVGDYEYTEQVKDIADGAYAALVGALPVQELLNRLDTLNEHQEQRNIILQAMADCICAIPDILLTIAGGITGGLTGEIFNPGGLPESAFYPPASSTGGNPVFPLFGGGVIDVGVGSIPSNISTMYTSPTGAVGWDKWREYVCSGADMIRRASIILMGEIEEGISTQAISVAIVAAALTGASLIAIGLVIPVALGAGVAVLTITALLIQGGDEIAEQAETFLRDENAEFWPDVACIMSSSLNSPAAAASVRQRIDAMVSNELTASLLKLLPWDSWIEQVYQGKTADGNYIDVSGIPSLCGDCDEVSIGAFLGTTVTDCEVVNWTVQAFWGYGIYDSGVICQGTGATIRSEYSDGVFGGSAFDNLTLESSPFIRSVGNWRLAYRASSVNEEHEGDSYLHIAILDHVTGDIIYQAEAAINDTDSAMMFFGSFELDDDTAYRVLVTGRYIVFETYNGAVVPAP